MIDAGSTELNNAWKNVLHNEAEDYIIPESNVNVMCPYDTTDLSGCTIYGWSSTTLCDLSVFARNNIVINRDRKLATFEWNFWVLDGTFEVLDTNEQIKGFMSFNISGENCTFIGTTPYVYLDAPSYTKLNKKQTLKFAPSYNEVPSQITMFTQTNDTVRNTTVFDIESQLETDNLQEREYIHLYSDSIDDTLEDIRIGITFDKTLMPYRRARLTEYNNGYYFFLDKYDLQSFVHTRTTSFNSEELPQNDLEISFVDLVGIFDSEQTFAPFHIIFNNSHRFYIYCGYNFDNIGWNYVQIDLLGFNELTIDRNSIQTTLKLQSTIHFLSSHYNTNDLDVVRYTDGQYIHSKTYPDDWRTFADWLDAMEIHYNFTYTLLNGGGVSGITTVKEEWQNYLKSTTIVGESNDFTTITIKEILQQIASVLRCALVREPNSYIGFLNLYGSNLPIVDTITPSNLFEYPTKISGEDYKYIFIKTPHIYIGQSDDEETAFDEGQISFECFPAKKRFTISNSKGSEELTLQINILPLNFKSNGLPVACWTWSDNIFSNYANHYSKVKRATRYEFNDGLLNPLYQVGDNLQVYFADGINSYNGLIEKIEINYDGSFRGAITLCDFYNA